MARFLFWRMEWRWGRMLLFSEGFFWEAGLLSARDRLSFMMSPLALLWREIP